MSAPRVSVVIPTYNHRDFVRATLDSVFQQSMSDFEIIVVNDGSTDDTRDVLAPLVREKRIEYIEQPNQGQATARNTGIQRARGEYVALLDDDDLWPADKLHWQSTFLDEHRSVAVIGGTLQIIDSYGAEGGKAEYRPLITFETLFAGNPFYSPGQTLIRSEVLKRVGGMTAQIWGADDWDLWFRIARDFKLVMQDRLSLYYRQHPGNASKHAARLVNACCVTIEHHLQQVPIKHRKGVRALSHSGIYRGMGSPIVITARQHMKNGDVIGALRMLSGVRPLLRSMLLETDVRRPFLDDLLHG